MLSATPENMRGALTGIEFMQVASAPTLGNVESGVVARADEPPLLGRVRAASPASEDVHRRGALPGAARYDSKRDKLA
jgi:hypothetical protein